MSDSQIESLCDRFDAAWSAGQPLEIEGMLRLVQDDQRGKLLRALLEIEFEYRLNASEPVEADVYRERFPTDHSVIKEAIEAAKTRLVSSARDDLSATNIVDNLGSSESQSDVPNRIGPFKILQPIGHGGMGQVFMAEQTEPVRRRVALKIIKTETPTKEILARFEAERQALAMMDHQNIAKVLDAGVTEEGRPYFAMELVKGVPITDYCDKNRLTPDERLELFVQTCRAIQHAHQKGIIHRDIKPSNVFVTLYDGKPVAKVIDFGLAKALQSTTQLTNRTLFTQFGQVVGTLAYMSPEQAEMNALDVDTRTDVYSLGVILYELLTGSTPITRDRIRSEAFDRILALIREEEAARPSQRLSDSGEAITGISDQRKTEPKRLSVILKGDLDWIAVKALEKDRTRRYDTPSALADDVQRYLSNEAIEARPPSFGYRLQKSFGKHRGKFIAGASIAILLIAGLVGTGTMWYRASNAESSARVAEGKATNEAAKTRHALKQVELERDKAHSARNDAVEAESQTKRASLRYSTERYAATLADVQRELTAGHRDKARQLLLSTASNHRGWEFDMLWASLNHGFSWLKQTSSIRCLDVSADQTLIAAGAEDGKIRIWNIKEAEIVFSAQAHFRNVTSVKFDLSARKLASAGEDGFVRVWEIGVDEPLESWSFQADALDLAMKFIQESDFQNTKNERSSALMLKFDEWIVDVVNRTGRDFTGSRISILARLPIMKFLHSSDNKPPDEQVMRFVYRSLIDTSAYRLTFSAKETHLFAATPAGVVEFDLATKESKKTEIRGKNICFSPDGDWVAASRKEDVVIWDLNTKERLAQLRTAGNPKELQFSSSCKHIACRGNKVEWWNIESGNSVNQLESPDYQFESIAMSRDGSTIATTASDGVLRTFSNSGVEEFSESLDQKCKTLTVLDSGVLCCVLGDSIALIEPDKLKSDHPETGAQSIAASHDGRWIAGMFDSEFKVWDAKTLEVVSTWEGKMKSARVLNFSNDSNYVLAADGTSDCTISIWRAIDGKLMHKIAGRSVVDDADFIEDLGLVATSNRRGFMQIFDAADGSVQHDFEIDNLWLNFTKAIPGTNHLIVAGGGVGMAVLDLEHLDPPGPTVMPPRAKVLHYFDQAVSVWREFYGHLWDVQLVDSRLYMAARGGIDVFDLNTGLGFTLKHSDRVQSLRLSNDKTRLFSGVQKRLVIWDLAVRKPVLSIETSLSKIQAIRQLDNGMVLAVGARATESIEAKAGPALQYIDDHLDRIECIDVVDDTRIVTGGEDRRIKLRYTSTLDSELELSMQAGVRSTFVSRDKSQLFGCDQDGCIRVWDLSTGRLFAESKRTQTSTGAIAKHPHENFLIVGGYSQYLTELNSSTLEVLNEIEFNDKVSMSRLAFSPDGLRLFGAADEGLYVWDWKSREQVRHDWQLGEVNDVVCDKALWVLGAREVVKLDSTSFEEIGRINFPVDVTSFDLSSHTNQICVATENSLRLFDTESLKPRGSASVDGRIGALAFSEGGNRVFAGVDSVLAVWDVSQHSTAENGSAE